MSIFFDSHASSGFAARPSVTETPIAYGGEEVGFAEAFSQGYDTQTYSGNVDSFVELLSLEMQPIIETIEERSGESFTNPGDYFGMSASMGHNERRRLSSLNQIIEHISQNEELYPEYAGISVDSLTANIEEAALASMEKGQEVSARQNLAGDIGQFMGQVGGAFGDDAFLEIMVSAPIGIIGNTAKSLAQVSIREAVIGAGYETILQAGVMEWYDDLGLEYTKEQYLKAVAFGGVIGGALPVALKGGVSGVQMTTGQIKKTIQGMRSDKMIPEKEADLLVDALDDVEALESAPTSIDPAPAQTVDGLFLENTPDFVAPIRNKDGLAFVDDEIAESKSLQPFDTVDELYERAPAVQSKLEAVGKSISEKLGVKFKTPGLKLRSTTDEKMGRKGFKSAKELTDVVRSGFVAGTPRKADEIVVELANDFDVIDEGWVKTPEGYFDRKVLVKTEDGVMGEVQIWSEALLNAKEKKGHALYTKWRSAKTKAQRWLLAQRMKKLYAQALKGENSNYITLSGILSDPNLRENLDVNSSRDGTTDAVVNTSSQSTETQSPPGSSSAMAVSESTSMAGRPSQEANVVSNSAIGDSPIDNIGDMGEIINNLRERMDRADEATAAVIQGKLPEGVTSPVDKAPTPPKALSDDEVDRIIDQIGEDTGFERMSDDESFFLDDLDGDAKERTGADVKQELANDQSMLDRLRGCVI